MGRQAWAVGTLCLLLCVGVSSVVSANQDLTYEPGYVEWDILPMERLFVEGSDVEEAVLQRGQTDSAVGGFTVGLTNGPVPVFTLESPPVEQAIDAEVLMSVYFFCHYRGWRWTAIVHTPNHPRLEHHPVLQRLSRWQRDLQQRNHADIGHHS